jgi:sugar lactone lactonase YvrE
MSTRFPTSKSPAHRLIRVALLLGALAAAGCSDDDGVTPPFETPVRTGTIEPVQSGWFESPFDIAVAPDGALYVRDAGERNVRYAPPRSQPTRSLDLGPGPIGVSREWLYRLDGPAHRIHRYDREGRLQADFSFEAAAMSGNQWLAVTPEGDLYIVDALLRRVLHLDGDGAPVSSWGTRGTGPGQFEHPTDIVVDAAGRILVLDIDLWRIQRFMPNGAPDRSWDIIQRVRFGSYFDGSLAVDADGNPWLLDITVEPFQVSRFDAAGTGVTSWPLDNPIEPPIGFVDLACLPSGELVIADNFDGVLRVYSRDFEPLGRIGHERGLIPEEFDFVGGIAWLDDDLIVGRTGYPYHHLRFAADGSYVDRLILPESLDLLNFRARGDGTGWAWDNGARGFGRFRLDGAGALSWNPVPLDPEFGTSDFEVLNDGGVLLLGTPRSDRGKRMVVRRYDAIGRPRGEWRLPEDRYASDLAASPLGLAWVLDSAGTIWRIDFKASDGDSGDWTPLAPLAPGLPVAIAADDQGRLHVADAGRRAIIVLGLGGEELGRYADGVVPAPESEDGLPYPVRSEVALSLNSRGGTALSIAPDRVALFKP